jgi:glutaredoxin
MSAGIDFYWRPGCGFCWHLERALTKAGVPLNKHNIWEQREHAEVVRTWANGNETVPTVVIGPVGLVNPSAAEVVVAMRAHRAELLPESLRAPQ